MPPQSSPGASVDDAAGAPFEARPAPHPTGDDGEAALSLEALFARLDSSPAGLSADEAARRALRFGPNEPAPTRHRGPLREFLRFCTNPLVVILLVASIISAFLGQVIDAGIIAAMVLLSIALNFVQAYRSQRAVERLREQVAPTATVLRDGEWIETPRRSLVPGDVVRLSAGDLVPADARLLESRDLHVQEAALTGESAPAEKSAAGSVGGATGTLRSDMVYLGTSVVSGSATALIVATGPATAFGDIVERLAVRPPETEFDRGARQFGILIVETVLFLVLFILLVNIAMHRNAMESLLFAVALAVGLTPEFLPMITTVTLASGAVRMAREKVIVKHLAAIQNFGSIDVLCSDKTGTLTASAMTLDRALDPAGRPSERPLHLARLNSLFETGIRSPLDAAILAGHREEARGWEKTDEIPFDFERRRLSIVVEGHGTRMLITKGAPESILDACTRYEADGAQAPFGEDGRVRCRELYRELNAEGFRVLAVAWRPVAARAGFTAADETDLVLAGFLTFIDPPLEGVENSIAALRRDGVTVKILTGDNELVTRHICSQVGIDAGRIVLGAEIERMSDAALAHVAEEAHVFARVSPAQKNRIIRALKLRSHVVGFLGDGINDAPSLHAADVGISVAGAVDVAKDAADIILLEHHLQVLHSGIIEGRKAFGNVLKYLLMGTSSNFGNMFSMAGASLFLPFLPMLPTQILLNNFLYDLAQVMIPTDNVDPAYIRRPQRWDIRIIRNFMVVIGPISSIYDFLTFFVLLALFHSSEELFHTGWFVESLTTQTLVLFVIRTAGNPLSSRPSRALGATIVAVVLAGILMPLTPLGRDMGFVPLPAMFFVFLIVATGTYLVLVELVKRRLIGRLLGDRDAATARS
ncbi:MAG TPA: magnesium-translocating P-type ATPase [Candidatus Binataceae bacterium]|nr:magnesium-translocating P-type ATPase [Candidatus Binataceae bacterium]